MKNYCITLVLFLCITKIYSQTLLRSKESAHEGGVNSIAMSNDGSMFVTGGNDTKTYLWNTKSFEKLKGALKHNEKVTAVAINSTGKYYASGSSDFKIRVIDIEQGLPIRILGEHTMEITGLAFHPFTDYFASASKDKTIKIWDNSKSKTSTVTITNNEKEVSSLAFTPDGKLLVSGSLDGKLRCYDGASGESKEDLYSYSKGITCLCISSDGSFIAIGCTNGDVLVINSETKAKVVELNNLKSQVNTLSFSGDAHYLAAGGLDKKIIIWNLSGGKVEKEIPAHEKEINGLAFTPKGDALLSVGADGNIKAWDVSSLKIGAKKFPKSADPVKLAVSNISIKESNNNGLLDGGEKAGISLSINNQGKTAAYNVIVHTSIQSPVSGLEFEKDYFVGNIDGEKTQSVVVPLKLSGDLQAASGNFMITVTEGSGVTTAPSNLSFQSAGASNYSYIMVLGQGFTSATGKAEIGAPITLKLKLKNIAKTEAKNIKVNFLLPENVKAVNKLSELIPSMSAGEEKEVTVDFYADKAFTLPEIKMLIDIEGAAFTNAKDIILKVKMKENLPMNEDYSSEVIASSNQLQSDNVASEDHPLYRGSTDPLKGLNVNKPKEMVIGNYYALIIGIDAYKSPWPALVNAVNDAKALEKTLKTNYKFDQFKTLYNEIATRDAIIREFEWLIANVKEGDNVFIYYSGHGEYKKELSKGYWVPADAISSSTSKYISNSDIQTYINGIKSKHTLLISDACFSGDIFRGNTLSVPFEESEKYYREVHGIPSRQALTSGGIEPVMDGGKEGHSVFAYYLLKTLEANKGKYFDVSQLYTKVKIPVINNSEQTPKLSPIKNAGDEGGQFIFIRK
jgi:WD40 repeat protein